MTGLRLSKKDYYNLARSQSKHTPEEELIYTLGFVEEEGFHVRALEKYLVENNRRVAGATAQKGQLPKKCPIVNKS